MIIFLYGEDTYRSRQKLQEIVDQYKSLHQKGLSLKFFDGTTLDFEVFKSELQTTSMFKEKKLFIINGALANDSFKESFLENHEKFQKSESIILFYEIKSDFKKDPLFALLKKEATSQEFEIPTGQRLKVWLQKEFEKAGARTAPQVQELMIEAVGNNLWQLSNEVQKLAAFKRGGVIEPKDVRALVKPQVETDIFKTIDAIALKNKKQALYLLRQHLEKGDSPLYLLSMMAFQFRNILGIKDLVEKGKSYARCGLHPFVARKSYQQSQKFTLAEIKKIYQKIFEVDLSIKTGKMEPETALELLVADL